MSSTRARRIVATLSLVGLLTFVACGGDDGGPADPGNPNRETDPDVFTLSIAGGPATTYTEGSGAPDIACDPRIDWYLYQVHVYDNYTNGAGPNGYDFFFGFLFPMLDEVGTYTVHDDELEAHFNNGVRWIAHPNAPTSDGTVTVTRSDDRIQGTFSVTMIDLQTQTTYITVSGSFDVDSGYSMTCPP